MKPVIEIAIVDDDRDDREIFAEAAKAVDPDIVCHEFDRGEKLFDFFRRSDAVISFIALDINMPQLNGWQVLEILKSIPGRDQTPVMICSTTARPEDAKRGMLLGAYSVVVKPDSFEDWKKILADALKVEI